MATVSKKIQVYFMENFGRSTESGNNSRNIESFEILVEIHLLHRTLKETTRCCFQIFPPKMHVHCAQNALPEASKELYMKIVQGEADIEHERNVRKTNKTTSYNSSNKQQNWMQFFG